MVRASLQQAMMTPCRYGARHKIARSLEKGGVQRGRVPLCWGLGYLQFPFLGWGGENRTYKLLGLDWTALAVLFCFYRLFLLAISIGITVPHTTKHRRSNA